MMFDMKVLIASGESQRAAIIHLLKHRCRVQRQQYADRHDDRRQPFDLKPALQFRREHADGNGQQCRHRNRGIKRQIDVAGLQIAFLHDRIRESEFRQHLDQHQHQPSGGDHAVIGRAEETGEDDEENGGEKLAAPVLDDGPEHAFQGRIAYRRCLGHQPTTRKTSRINASGAATAKQSTPMPGRRRLPLLLPTICSLLRRKPL